MRKQFYILVLLLIVLLLSLCSYANLPFTVRVIYFQPTDAPLIPANLSDLILDVQDFYRAEMDKHGYGTRTFRLETDVEGNPVIHTINGRQNSHAYINNTWDTLSSELPVEFKNINNIHIVIVGGVNFINNQRFGIGWPYFGHASGGIALIANPHADMLTIAHELDHAFALYHKRVGGPSVMGRGENENGQSIALLANYEARWLDKHHYFNNWHQIDGIPQITKIHKFREIKQDVVRFRFDVESKNELHQAQIFRASDVGVIGWTNITKNNAETEFLAHKIKLSRDGTM